MRLVITYLLLLALCTHVLHAEAKIKRPTEKVYEAVVGYGRDAKRAESEALSNASVSSGGKFDLKSIRISGGKGECYCMLGIEYKIYAITDKIKVQEVTVGYGSDMPRAELSAKAKGRMMAAKNGGSARTGDGHGRVSSGSLNNYFKIKSSSFSKIDKDTLCYIKFEYLRDKESS